MEAYFATIFEDVRHEWPLIIILSLTDPDLIKRSIFTDHETNIIKNLSVEKIHRQNIKRIRCCIII